MWKNKKKKAPKSPKVVISHPLQPATPPTTSNASVVTGTITGTESSVAGVSDDDTNNAGNNGSESSDDDGTVSLSSSPAKAKYKANIPVSAYAKKLQSMHQDVAKTHFAEEKLFDLIKAGNSKEVKRHIRESLYGGVKFDLNTVNSNDENLLLAAVRTKNLSIVKALMYIYNFNRVRGISVRRFRTNQALLEAIEDNEIAIISAITEVDEDAKKYGNAEMMIKAVKNERYEIMKLLHDQNAEIPLAEDFPCCCKSCFETDSCGACWCFSANSIEPERTRERIVRLKVLANPMFMIFKASQNRNYDPVYEAMKLTLKISAYMKFEPEFKEEYKEIRDQVESLPVDLIKLCRDENETKIFLSQNDGYKGSLNNRYPRLAVALECGQKKFVAQENVQFLIYSDFRGGWTKCSQSESKCVRTIINGFSTFLMVAFGPVVAILVWFLTLFHCCTTKKKQEKDRWLSPYARALTKLGSHLWFCVALITGNAMDRPEGQYKYPLLDVFYNFPAACVVWYIACHVFATGRLYFRHKLTVFRRGWYFYDLLMCAILILSIVAWYVVYCEHKNLGFEEIISRRKRKWDDWLLIAECIYAVACTLATFRTARWYLLNPTVGPFQTAYAGLQDVVFVVAFYLGWMMAMFVFATNIIYRPYKGLKKWDPKNEKWEDQPDDLADPLKIFMNIFGMADGVGPDHVAIFPYNNTFNTSDGSIPGELKSFTNEHRVTAWVAKIICAVFNIVVMSFLKDATIGLFGSAAGKILENKDVEWKYTRVKEWLYYIDDTRLAAPMTFFPNAVCFRNFFKWMTQKGTGKGQWCNYIDVELDRIMEDRRSAYPELMRKLFQRYFQLKNWTESDETMPKKKDKKDVEEKVQELKVLMDEALGALEAINSGPSATMAAAASKQPIPSTSKQAIAKQSKLVVPSASVPIQSKVRSKKSSRVKP